MSLFEKCYRFTKAREVMAAGYYPYFQPIEASYDTEVIIRGEKKLEKEQKDKEFYRVERSYGSFRRVLSLPQDADRERIEARFKNGVLTIVLLRKAQTQTTGRRIEIKQAA